MELRRVRYFLAVAEHLNFRRAAEALKTSQPSLSQQIRGLEDELGFTLFERSKQHVRLTRAGASYLHGIRPIVAEFDACARRAHEAQDGTRGALSIGASGMVMIERLPGAVRAFTAQYPSVDVNVTILRSPDLLQALRRGRVDLAFSTAAASDDDLRSEPLWSFPPRLLLPNHHPRATDPEVRLRDLSGATLIIHPHRDGQSAGGNVMALCRELRFTPGAIREVSDVADFETLVGLVACGLGISILPSPFEAYLASPLIVFRKIAAAKRSTEISAWWRSGDHTPLVRKFVEAAKAIA
jgi:DNA-binding transcriptional LysR family regulator